MKILPYTQSLQLVNKGFYCIINQSESLLVVGNQVVDLYQKSALGTLLIAKIDKIAPGLGIAFVSWNDLESDRQHHGILPLLNYRGRGPSTLCEGVASFKYGDYVIGQIMEEGTADKVTILSTQISLVSSRIIAWPGSSRHTCMVISSCVPIEFRGCLGYMLRQNASCAGPQRWLKEKYDLEYQWENTVLKLLEQTSQVTTNFQEREIQTCQIWFEKPQTPWILTDDIESRELIGRWMLKHFPTLPRLIESIQLLSWKPWVSLHRAAISQPKIPLRSGGTLIREHTELGWNLDINSGTALNVGSKAQANQEAIYAMLQQMVIHSMKGLILIDFIPEIYLKELSNQLVNLSNIMDQDPYRARMISVSETGLLKLVRGV